LANHGSTPAWSGGWQTRAAVNRRSPNAGVIPGRLSDPAKRLDCGGFSTALVSDRAIWFVKGMIPNVLEHIRHFGKIVCIAEIRLLSVFICVHPWFD
jgi:hypothetical protein